MASLQTTNPAQPTGQKMVFFVHSEQKKHPNNKPHNKIISIMVPPPPLCSPSTLKTPTPCSHPPPGSGNMQELSESMHPTSILRDTCDTSSAASTASSVACSSASRRGLLSVCTVAASRKKKVLFTLGRWFCSVDANGEFNGSTGFKHDG